MANEQQQRPAARRSSKNEWLNRISRSVEYASGERDADSAARCFVAHFSGAIDDIDEVLSERLFAPIQKEAVEK
jgi:hypothetical protein